MHWPRWNFPLTSDTFLKELLYFCSLPLFVLRFIASFYMKNRREIAQRRKKYSKVRQYLRGQLKRPYRWVAYTTYYIVHSRIHIYRKNYSLILVSFEGISCHFCMLNRVTGECTGAIHVLDGVSLCCVCLSASTCDSLKSV